MSGGNNLKIVDVVIIGAGPAGISAAIQLKCYGIEPVIFERNKIGGLLRNANFVENYPGFPEGISGLDLVALFKKHLQNTSINIQYENIINIDYENDLFIISTEKTASASKALIIASGTNPRKFSFPVIAKRNDEAIHNAQSTDKLLRCARNGNSQIDSKLNDEILYEISSIIKIKDKIIAIIGAGDSAFDYAVNLAKNNKVLLLNRNNHVKCLPGLYNRCINTENILYFENTAVTKLSKLDSGLIITINNICKDIYVDYFVAAIGREANLDFISNNLKEKMENLLAKGLLFVIGDVKNNIYRQTAICAGDGIKAAMKIHQILIKGDSLNNEGAC